MEVGPCANHLPVLNSDFFLRKEWWTYMSSEVLFDLKIMWCFVFREAITNPYLRYFCIKLGLEQCLHIL